MGRLFAWAGLLMVLQQIIIVFMQRIFTRPDISFGFGIPLQFDISLVCGRTEALQCFGRLPLRRQYTFVQGGHVRVDLCLRRCQIPHQENASTCLAPSWSLWCPLRCILIVDVWLVFHVAAPDHAETLCQLTSLDLPAAQGLARCEWNVETIGFLARTGLMATSCSRCCSVAFAAMVFLQGIAVLHIARIWSCKEGEESEGKYLDKDTLAKAKKPTKALLITRGDALGCRVDEKTKTGR